MLTSAPTTWLLSEGLLGLLAAALVAVSAPGPARAESCGRAAQSQANAHKQAGLELRSSDPAAAALEFEAANELCPDPWYRGLLAVCFEKTGRVVDAIDAIDAYLEHSSVGQRDQALAARTRLVAMLSKVEIVTDPPGATLRLTGRGYESTMRSPAKLSLDPGRYTLDVSLEEYEPYRRELDALQGEELRVDVALTALEPALPSQPDAPEERRPEPTGPALTGSAGLALDGALPLAEDELKPGLGLLVELSGGFARKRLRVELSLQLAAFPDASGGYILELAGGPRLGIKLGSIPLWLEFEALVGWSLISVAVDNPTFPAGQHSGAIITPGVLLTYRVLRWLELFIRPARVEVLNLGGDLLGGTVTRWGLDAGVRFRR